MYSGLKELLNARSGQRSTRVDAQFSDASRVMRRIGLSRILHEREMFGVNGNRSHPDFIIDYMLDAIGSILAVAGGSSLKNVDFYVLELLKLFQADQVALIKAEVQSRDDLALSREWLKAQSQLMPDKSFSFLRDVASTNADACAFAKEMSPHVAVIEQAVNIGMTLDNLEVQLGRFYSWRNSDDYDRMKRSYNQERRMQDRLRARQSQRLERSLSV